MEIDQSWSRSNSKVLVSIRASERIQQGHQESQSQVVHGQIDEVKFTHRQQHEDQNHHGQAAPEEATVATHHCHCHFHCQLATKPCIVEVDADDANDATPWNHCIHDKQ